VYVCAMDMCLCVMCIHLRMSMMDRMRMHVYVCVLSVCMCMICEMNMCVCNVFSFVLVHGE